MDVHEIDNLGMLGEIRELEMRERAWLNEHPDWDDMVQWPAYIGQDGTQFEVFRVHHRTDRSKVIASTGRSWPEFLYRLEQTCLDGECGVDHADPPARSSMDRVPAS